MSAEIAARGVPDVPWSSTRRFIGVVLACVTFSLWVAAGVASLILLVVGGTVTRTAVVGYFLVAAVYAPPMNRRVYQYASGLEVGQENGWKLIVKGKVDCSKQPHLFCSHPHGCYCAGVSLNLVISLKALKAVNATHIRMFVHSLLAGAFPVVKDWVRSLGFLPCTREQMRRTLEGGESGCIVPGGVREVVWAGRVDRERLYLKHVFGFTKLAIQTGCPLVPVYTFGESLSTGPDWVPAFEARRALTYWLEAPVRYLNLCNRWLLPFPSGRLVTVVGSAIPVGPKTETPTRERVSDLHARYCAALVELIESTKEEAGYKRQVTELI
eukprot:CAMPEP_0197589096 /NCGR_PEP_ID=MMETSP1326-20131121/10153_1 /TAXON_ID=1155430 /ORGANISM="Genus nov. species nov., Strain RCC2288" /LENGTH=325 /DNA_ID=CAMNT_0043153997 /DNA_START=15 /DNA_END=992 /DNA_ORIENTATION=-